ncbi:MAG: type II toxin-antitoxin system RelB/DinJ family antitoxin [Methylothermaceae bacterium]|nr:type II toxin-antitoxin system RelB/DinJ family antitoxin [Methylothermaceae bacterium]
MPANAVVRVRVDKRVKNEVATILAAFGLTISDAFRMMLTVVDKTLPFEPLVPNAETIEAMKKARAGNLPRVNTVE